MDKYRKFIVILLFITLTSLIVSFVLKKPKLARSLTTYPVISEIQIAGIGVDDDFIELYNPTDSPYNLNGHRLVKRSSAGTTDTSIKAWNSETLIPARGYYLWANSGWTPSVTPDTTTAATLAANNGFALRLGAEDTGTIVDSVGLGSATNVFVETSAFPTNPEAGQSIERKPGDSDPTGGNGTDTNNNANDFAIRATSEPQNTSSTNEPPEVTPTEIPTPVPTAEPTIEPTVEPTPIPTVDPTPIPTSDPTIEPTLVPTQEPTPIPSETPTSVPTTVPTIEPSPTVVPSPIPEGKVIGIFGFGKSKTVCKMNFRVANFGFLKFMLPSISCSRVSPI